MSGNRRVKDIVEYLKEVSDIKAKWPNSTLVFRGQGNEAWSLESSAERRLKKSLPSQNRIPDQFFIEYHEDLLKKCKLKNYDQREQKQLDDLELLADLQHHGAATCLIDFTRNALVALWFACEKSEVNGKVFVVNTADAETFLAITHTDTENKENKSISNILEFKIRKTGKDQAAERPTPETFAVLPDKPSFWYWKPAHLNERITAQHSLFLFGLPSSGELRSEELIIDSGNKEQIREELEDLHNICEESLFPDFVGFACTQRSNAPYPTLDAKEYLRRGIEAEQRGQNAEAIQDLTKAIELNPELAEAYYIRGLAYSSQGEYEHAIQDYTKAIELEPEFAEAYYFRGSAYSLQGEYEYAIENWTKAIELEPDDAGTYILRGLAYYDQGEYEHVIEDSTKAIELEPDNAGTYLLRGHAYILQGSHDQAIQDFNKAVGLDPTDPKAYYARGLAWLALERWQNARSSLTAAKHMGFDLVGPLRFYANDIADFERKFGIILPEDITAMLTESEN